MEKQYKFSELTKAAKLNAIESNRKLLTLPIQWSDNEWYSDILDDWYYKLRRKYQIDVDEIHVPVLDQNNQMLLISFDSIGEKVFEKFLCTLSIKKNKKDILRKYMRVDSSGSTFEQKNTFTYNNDAINFFKNLETDFNVFFSLFLENIANTILNELKQEYAILTTNNARLLIEHFEANEYLFDQHGRYL